MKAKLLLIITLAFLSHPSNAQQWFYYKEFPVNVIPKKIASNNSGTLFMVTLDNEIYYKTAGNSWQKITHWSTLSLEGIAVDKNSNRVYIGTAFQGLFHSSDFGSNWGNNWMETSPVSGHHEGYSSFAMTNNPNLFFAGHFGTPKITVFTNQGTAGQVKTITGNPNATPSVLHYTANEKLLVGNHMGIWISDNNANTFSPTNHISGHVFSFTEDENGRVYALNSNISTQEITLLYSDDYTNWTTMSLPHPNEKYTTVFYDNASEHLWMGSESGIYKTPVNNINWENNNLNNEPHFVVSVVSDNNNGIYNFSAEYITQRLNTSNLNWEQLNDGLEGAIDQLTFNHNNRLFAYSNFFTNKLSMLEPQSEDWAGVHLGHTPYGINNVIVAGNNTVFANTFRKIYRSDNNGQSFTETNVPEDFILQTAGGISLFKKGELDGIFTSHSSFFLSQKIYGSFDGGQTWSVIATVAGNPNLSTTSSFSDFSQDANGRFFAKISFFGTDQLYTSVNGNNWQLIPFNYSNPTLSFAYDKIQSYGSRTFVAGRHIYEIKNNEGIFSLEAFNTSFLLPSNQLLGFKVTNEGHFIAHTFEGVYQSVDNGISWENIGLPTETIIDNSQLDVVAHYNDIPFIIVNDTNNPNVSTGIYYYIHNSLSTEEHSFSKSITIYPNPATDELFIQSETSIERLEIFDCSGRKILTNRQPDIKKIDIPHLVSGIYMIIIKTTDGNTNRMKFIKN